MNKFLNQPENPGKKTTAFPLRIDYDLWQEVKDVAQKDNRSQNQMVVELIKIGLKNFVK
jgi:hypothetical protein